MYSNYNDQNVAATDSQSELTKLRLENQALQMLLKEHLKKKCFAEWWWRYRGFLYSAGCTPKVQHNSSNFNDPTQAQGLNKGQIAEKGKAV